MVCDSGLVFVTVVCGRVVCSVHGVVRIWENLRGGLLLGIWCMGWYLCCMSVVLICEW